MQKDKSAITITNKDVEILKAYIHSIDKILRFAGVPLNIMTGNALLNLGISILLEKGDNEKVIATLEQAIHHVKAGTELS